MSIAIDKVLRWKHLSNCLSLLKLFVGSFIVFQFHAKDAVHNIRSIIIML